MGNLSYYCLLFNNYRVEGEHHRVKQNLNGRRFPFDTIFYKLNKVMEGQICEIKNVSRFNSSKAKVEDLQDFLFVDLNRAITLKAIDLIKKEMSYVPKRGQNPESCGCYIRRTHGLP